MDTCCLSDFSTPPLLCHSDTKYLRSPAKSSADIRERVNHARKIQQECLAPFGLHANSQMQTRHIQSFCELDEKGDVLLKQVTGKLGLSARSFTSILKLARTIADLAGVEQIEILHLSEAIQYRGQGRKLG